MANWCRSGTEHGRPARLPMHLGYLRSQLRRRSTILPFSLLPEVRIGLPGFGAPRHAAACQLLRRRFSVQHHLHQAFDRSMEVTFHHRGCTYRPVTPVVFFFLPDSPGQAKLLSEGEQTEAVERMQIKDRTPKNKVHWHQLFASIT